MINQRIEKIMEFFLKNSSGSSSKALSFLIEAGVKASAITVKRDLSKLVSEGDLDKQGKGPETSYSVTTLGRLLARIDAHDYCSVEPDKRFGNASYSFSWVHGLPPSLFTEKESADLEEATMVFKNRSKEISETAIEKELERFVIELSWKSSLIEGNTYNLLDTEKLIRQGVEAEGHSKAEAVMILNHKKAFSFARDHKESFKELNRSNVEKLHELLVGDLGIQRGYRHGLIGITGSKYRPLDNEHQIREAMEGLFVAVSKMADPYSKALIALLGLSYVQPFEDGNKRTSRLIANAILMAYGLAPLSYRSVDEESYKEAILVFYEINSVIPFKDIFLGQYVFAANNYAL